MKAVKRKALELVDTGLVMVSPRGNVSTASPGLAVVDGAALLVGLDAVPVARLKPRRLHSRFWQNLGTDSLTRPFPHHLRTADLAHAHLQGVWGAGGNTAEEVIVAVPGLYSQEQLGLLLGVARACKVPVRGLVDAAVAATADRATGPRCLHLDLHLHRAVLTEVEHRSEVVRGAVWEETRVGLLPLYDTWARVLSRIFVRSTRFDPLHRAATEQALYVQLPDHLAALHGRDAVSATFSSGGRHHTAELTRHEIVEAALPSYQRLSEWVKSHADADETSVLVTDRMAALPGLVDHLRDSTGLDVQALHAAAAGSAALHHANAICSKAETLPFVTRLPGYDAREPGPVTIAVTPPAGSAATTWLPTHIVIGGVAHRITMEPIALVASASSPESSTEAITVRRLGEQVVIKSPHEAATTVNGTLVEGTAALVSGDRVLLSSSGAEILIVTLAD